MKRALLIGAGTLAGTAAVLAYQPGSLFGTGGSAGAAAAAGAADAAPAAIAAAPLQQQAATPGQAAAAPAAAPAAASGTFTGAAARTRYGPVQVQLTVKAGQVTSVVGQQAATDGRSRMIASVALPQLQQQAVAAQSAAINGVSGASYTSAGFAKSLQSALQQAGLA